MSQYLSSLHETSETKTLMIKNKYFLINILDVGVTIKNLALKMADNRFVYNEPSEPVYQSNNHCTGSITSATFLNHDLLSQAKTIKS